MLYLKLENQNQLEYQKSVVEDAKVLHVEDEVNFKYDDIIVTDIANLKEFNALHVKIILLDSEPTFAKFLKYMKQNVKAYANVYIHKSHILSAIQSVKDNQVWVYPDFLSKVMMMSSSSTNSIDDKLEPLTQREKEIANLIYNGLTNKEISAQLNISTNTIKIHTKNIYSKLHVKDRLSLFKLLNG